MRLDAAALGCGAYVVVHEALRFQLHEIYGEQDCGGTPCWRARLVLFAQTICMPMACCAAAWNHNWSLRQWCTDSGLNGPNVATRLLNYIFYVYLLLDCWYVYLFPDVLIMRMLMIVHHVICFLGHTYALFFCPSATLPCYVAGITFLEIGSAFANVFHIWRWWSIAEPLYFGGMALANGVALILMWYWNVIAKEVGVHALRRWPAMICTVLLIYFRQKEVQILTGLPGFMY